MDDKKPKRTEKPALGPARKGAAAVAGRSSGPIVTVRAWNRAPIEDLRLSPYANL
jgi:hypothetical protein